MIFRISVDLISSERNIFSPDVCDTICSAWFYFRLMDLALSSDAYQGAEATCSSTVFSPSPD